MVEDNLIPNSPSIEHPQLTEKKARNCTYYELPAEKGKVKHPDLQEALRSGLVDNLNHYFICSYYPDEDLLVFSSDLTAAHTTIDNHRGNPGEFIEIWTRVGHDNKTKTDKRKVMVLQKEYNPISIERVKEVIEANWPSGNNPRERYLINTTEICILTCDAQGEEIVETTYAPLQKTFPLRDSK